MWKLVCCLAIVAPASMQALAAAFEDELEPEFEEIAQASPSLSVLQDMAFGSVSGDFNLVGSVTVSPSGVKTVAGGARNFGGTHRAARFRVKGAKGSTVQIILPNSFTITTAGRTMTVDNLTHDCPAPCTLPNNGRKDFNVGGRLNLAPNQSSGTYSGNLTATVLYAP